LSAVHVMAPSVATPRARFRSNQRQWSLVLGVIGTCLIIAAWATISALEVVAPTSMPSPLAVARRMIDLLSDRQYWVAVQDTMWTWVLSLLLVSAVAIPLGLVIGQIDALSRPVNVAVSAFRSIPATALLPVAILTFKLGWEMKLALTFYAVIWPVLINAIYGSQSTDKLRLDVARSLRWSPWRRFSRVVLPSAAPLIATGIRIASGTALVVILSAELLGASKGV
jgi:ABC-type nitrate/sulfonate/bicarbonate transport system permease component